MVSSLSTYLAKEIFPIYVGQLDEESVTGIRLQARVSWLHLVDLMITFDKRVESLAISSAFLQRLSSLIDRCRSIPRISLRSRFVRVAGAPIIHKFLDSLLHRCQEAEGLTALTDDAALVKVTRSINAAHYFETVLKEWCEDVFFLEMGLNQGDPSGIPFGENGFSGISVEDPGNGILDEETGKLEEFRSEWIEKLSTVVLRGFDARFRDYIKNRKQWQEKGEEGLAVSKPLVGALDYLHGKMSVLEGSLNKMDFVGVWRRLATGVDKLVFNGILMSNAKFYNGGTEKLGNDMAVLFGVFGAWCLRPEGFFPKLSEGLKLLKMGEKQLQGSSLSGERWFKENGIRHLSASEAERIIKNRVYIR